MEQVNDDLAAKLDEIIQLPFFRYQKVNLFPECAFWQEDGSCMNRACAVQETDEVRLHSLLFNIRLTPLRSAIVEEQ